LKDTWPFPLVKRFDGISDIAQLRKVEQENAEGFVVRFESSLPCPCTVRNLVVR